MRPLLEREAEQAELRALIGAAREGHGGFAVVEAAVGLGKTRLLALARHEAVTAGLQVLAARATELERDFAYALVRQLLEPALVALDEPSREAVLAGAAGAARGPLGLDDSGASTDTFAVLHGVYWLIAALAERGPLLLAVDDAHWADAASLDALAFLVPRLEELPVVLVLACRPSEPGAEPRLGPLTTDPLARRLTPRALSPRAAAALLAEELEHEPERTFTATCHEVSGGNPFLLHELARTIAAEAIPPLADQATRIRELAPERVTRTVLVRLARLSPAARRVAHAVAVLGDGTDTGLAATLVGLDPTDAARGADELRAVAILDADAALRVVHPLVRTALAADLPAGARATLHRRAVEVLRGRGASAEQLAAQLVATDPRGERTTVETLLHAARAALGSGAPRSAIAYLRRAWQEPPPDDLRVAVLDDLLTANVRAPDRVVFRELLPLVLSEVDGDDASEALRVRWSGKIAIWMILHGHARDAVGLLERGVATADARGEAERAFRLEAQLGLVVPRSIPTTRARLAPYLDRIDPDSKSGRLAAALASEWHAFDGTAGEATDAARRALARDARIFVEQPEFFAPGRPVLALLLADRIDEAGRAVERALAYARERSAAPELVAASWMSSGVAFASGDLAGAEADARHALEIARLARLPFAELLLRSQLACVLVTRGEVDAADAELGGPDVEARIRDDFVRVVWLFARSELRLAQGRFDEAVTDLLDLHRRSRGWGVIGTPAPPPSIGAARALASLGHHERARDLAEAALAHARHFGAPSLMAHALGARAAAVDGDERLTALQDAVAVLDGSPAVLVRARTLAEHGAALRRAGRRADARVPLREALDLARRCGAAGLAKTAFDELTATGERVRRHTPIGVESLTPSERRVAELAARGLTNRQIAQSLFLTVKTIETHLAATYDKLAIRSRQELPDALGPRSRQHP